MRSLLTKAWNEFLYVCKPLALGENVQKKDGERKTLSNLEVCMYVCMAQAF